MIDCTNYSGHTFSFIEIKLYEANKLSILTLMQRHKDVVVKYINENKVSLTSEQDLTRLDDFLQWGT